MQMVRKIVVLSGALLIGFLIGPILVAVTGGLIPPAPQSAKPNLAYQLLDAYDYYRPEPVVMFSSDPDGMINDCGYEKGAAFENNDNLNDGSLWTPYNGYFDLSIWVSDEFYNEIKRRRTKELSKELSSFDLRFLNECIRDTAVASICARKVHDILDASGLGSSFSLSGTQSRPDQTRRFNSICTYLDGLVARRGGRLSTKGRSGRWPNY